MIEGRSLRGGFTFRRYAVRVKRAANAVRSLLDTRPARANVPRPLAVCVPLPIPPAAVGGHYLSSFVTGSFSRPNARSPPTIARRGLTRRFFDALRPHALDAGVHLGLFELGEHRPTLGEDGLVDTARRELGPEPKRGAKSQATRGSSSEERVRAFRGLRPLAHGLTPPNTPAGHAPLGSGSRGLGSVMKGDGSSITRSSVVVPPRRSARPRRIRWSRRVTTCRAISDHS